MTDAEFKLLFKSQRYQAKRRGIDFQFTYDEWVQWWAAELGPEWFKKRGRNYDQYVMSRNGDKGPYAAWNVKSVLAVENHAATFKHKPLTEEVIKAIFLDTRKLVDIAKAFEVPLYKVAAIKQRQRYTEFTNGLSLPIKRTITMNGKTTIDYV